jgi:hypothetical protein
MPKNITYISEFYSATDLSLSAALITLGYKLISIDKQNYTKAEFLFKPKSTINDDIDRFWARKLKQDSRTYFENLKLLKNMLHSNVYDPNR